MGEISKNAEEILTIMKREMDGNHVFAGIAVVAIEQADDAPRPMDCRSEARQRSEQFLFHQPGRSAQWQIPTPRHRLIGRLPGFGAPGECRTPDLRVRSATLYPLSYGRSQYPSGSGGRLRILLS